MSFTSTDGVNIPDLPLLHAECMTIRRWLFARTIKSREADIYIDGAQLNINDVSPINNLDCRWET